MVDVLQCVDLAISRHDYEAAVSLLEPLSDAGDLSQIDEVALALLLMWPPIAAWDLSLTHLRLAMNCNTAFEAAVWGAYLCDTLYPVTDEFHLTLPFHSNHAEACLMLSDHARIAGDAAQARSWLQRCHEIDRFPRSVYLEWLYCEDKEQAQKLIREAATGVRDRHLEQRDPPTGRLDLRERNWAELIRGEALTSHVWGHLYEGRI